MVADIVKRRYITMGIAAWLLLLPLAVTSTNWAIRKMGGKNWNRLHKLVYAAAVCGIIHYWWQVKSGVITPLGMTLVLAVLFPGAAGAGVAPKAKGAGSRCPQCNSSGAKIGRILYQRTEYRVAAGYLRGPHSQVFVNGVDLSILRHGRPQISTSIERQQRLRHRRKTLAMQRRRPQPRQRLQMLPRAISFMPGQTIAGKNWSNSTSSRSRCTLASTLAAAIDKLVASP